MTVAVIGHGRSPEGRRWANRIDSCSTVVRMWDWTWQDERDYGTKYSFGLFVLTPKQFGYFQIYNKRYPDRGWWAYMGKPTNAILPNKTELIDTTHWVDVAMAWGAAGLTGRLTLTRGCVAACRAIQGARPGESVVLVGFDNVLAKTNQPIEQSFHPTYWSMYTSRFADDGKPEKTYPVGQPKTATHDMTYELPLLRKLADAAGVELCFAQERWD